MRKTVGRVATRPVRIAIIAGQLVVGGAERQLYLWLSNLDRDRFDPMVVTLKSVEGDYWEQPVRALGIPLVRETHSANPFVRLAALTRQLSKWQPSIIHGWHLFASPYAGAAARMLGAAGIGSLRSSARAFESRVWEARLSERLVDAMLVNSESAAAELSDAGRCGRQRMFVVPNAVLTEDGDRALDRAAIAAALRLDLSAPWVGAMGRMVEGKGFETALDVFQQVRRTHPRAVLILYGDGPLRSSLEARASTLGITDAVRFAGEIPDARAQLGALDAFCFLSEDEGMPNAVLEAASCGVAIVGWHTSFLREAAGDGALLVGTGDRDALRNALVDLLADRDRAARVGSAARAHVQQRFGVDQYVERMTAVYDEMSA